MPFVPAPNIVMVEWRCTRNAQQVENRLMVDMLTVPVGQDMTDLAVAMWNWWENDHAALLVPQVNLREVVVTSLHVQNGPQQTYAPDTTTVGTLGGFALPNEVSMCVSLRTGVRGRSARGRWYMLSISDDQLANTNEIDVAAATAMVVSLNALMTAVRNEGREPVIVSFQSNGVPRPGGPVYFPITTATVVDNVLDSMRRRKPGVGS